MFIQYSKNIDNPEMDCFKKKKKKMSKMINPSIS